MYNRLLSATALALVSATASQAQSLEYLTYGADYTRLDVDSYSADITSAQAGFSYRVNTVFVSGDLSYARVADDTGDLNITNLDVMAGVYVTPSAVIYGGIDSLNTSETDSLSSYTIGGEMSFGPATVAISYNDSSEDNYVATTSLYGSYMVNEQLEIFLGIGEFEGETSTTLGAIYDDGTFDVNAVFADDDAFELFAFDGSYAFGNGFRASAGFADFDGLANVVTVGGGYEVSDDLWLDLEVGRVTVDGASERADTIGLSLTYEMGRQGLLIDRATTATVDALGPLGTVLEAGGL